MSIITSDWRGRTIELPEDWHRWYAWRPIRLTGTLKFRWLCDVERRFTVVGGWDSYGGPNEYRDAPKEPKA